MPQTEINFIVLMFLKSPLVSLQGSERASIIVKEPWWGQTVIQYSEKKSIYVSNSNIAPRSKWYYSVQAVWTWLDNEIASLLVP